MSLNGSLFSGYDSGWGSGESSAHSVLLGVNADMNGSYFSPQFLSFYANNTYDRAQEDSQAQSISNGDTFGFGARIFGGSHFPGSISYSKGFNNTGTVASELPGLTTHGEYSFFRASWGAYIPGWPSLSLGYAETGSSVSIFGIEGGTTSSQHNFSAGSAYSFHLSGWKMNLDGRYTRNWGTVGTPQFLTGQTQEIEAPSSGSSGNVHAWTEHSTPLNGNFSASVGRNMYEYNFSGSGDSGSSDTLNALLTFRPLKKLSAALDAAYSDSAFGSVSPDILASGNVASNLGTVRTTLLNGSTMYPFWRFLSAGLIFTREDQFFAGQHYGANQWGVNVNFSPLWGKKLGDIRVIATLIDTATQAGNTNLGGTASASYARRIGTWKIGANFAYSQNVQTILLVYTVSTMSYGANVAHKFGNISWTGGFGGGHSVLTPQMGSSSHSEAYFSNFSWRMFSIAGNYSQGSGYSVVTPNGLVPVNPGTVPLISPNALIFYDSHSFNVSFGGQPFRRASLSIGYSDSLGTTTSSSSSVQYLLPGGQNFFFGTDYLYGMFVYNFRKLAFSAQFNHFKQDTSLSSALPSVVNSYSFGVSRMFNIF